MPRVIGKKTTFIGASAGLSRPGLVHAAQPLYAQLRDRLKADILEGRLKPGDKVKFFIHPDGRVMLLPTVPISQLRGILKKPGRKPVTIEEMDDAIAEAVAEDDRRIIREWNEGRK